MSEETYRNTSWNSTIISNEKEIGKAVRYLMDVDLDIPGERGQAASATILVENRGEESVEMRVKVYDWTTHFKEDGLKRMGLSVIGPKCWTGKSISGVQW